MLLVNGQLYVIPVSRQHNHIRKILFADTNFCSFSYNVKIETLWKLLMLHLNENVLNAYNVAADKGTKELNHVYFHEHLTSLDAL